MIPHLTTGSRPPVASPSTEAAASPSSGTQLLRLLVHQSGSQRTTVTITERHDSPVLHVRAGSVFVYASTPEVVAAHLAAWRDTSLAARHVSGMIDAVPSAPAPSEPSEMSVIVRQDRTPTLAVTRFPVDPRRPRTPFVETVIGPITVRSYDRQSIADVLGVWLQAAALGAIVWATPALADL